MNNLGGLLAKFNNLLKNSRDTKSTVMECLTKVIGIQFEEKDFDVRGDVLYITAHPSIKNEVFIRKAIVLAELKILLDKRAPRDIR